MLDILIVVSQSGRGQP